MHDSNLVDVLDSSQNLVHEPHCLTLLDTLGPHNIVE